MAAIFAIIYFIGVFGAVLVGRARVGLSQLGRLSAATVFGSLPWAISQMVTLLLWPAALVLWLARGRPECPWEAAETRSGSIRVRRRSAQAANSVP
jgi:hypothetical protein